MKQLLDWQSDEVVAIWDEISLWSAPFGRLLLENIPMKRKATVVDIGFGTGFPLIELSQRFGADSRIIGIDIWKAAIERSKQKLAVLGLQNIEILEADACQIALENELADLVTSNLGINNFEEKEQVYAEIKRILKPTGRLCITTNPIGTFDELFSLFLLVAKELDLKESLTYFKEYIQHRQTAKSLEQSFNQAGFRLVKRVNDSVNMRFTNALAVLNHSLIRIGFRSSWENNIPEIHREFFFNKLLEKIDEVIDKEGIFKMSIPILYLEFQKII